MKYLPNLDKLIVPQTPEKANENRKIGKPGNSGMKL